MLRPMKPWRFFLIAAAGWMNRNRGDPRSVPMLRMMLTTIHLGRRPARVPEDQDARDFTSRRAWEALVLFGPGTGVRKRCQVGCPDGTAGNHAPAVMTVRHAGGERGPQALPIDRG